MNGFPPRCPGRYPNGQRCYNYSRVALIFCHAHRDQEMKRTKKMNNRQSKLLIWICLLTLLAIVITGLVACS